AAPRPVTRPRSAPGSGRVWIGVSWYRMSAPQENGEVLFARPLSVGQRARGTPADREADDGERGEPLRQAGDREPDVLRARRHRGAFSSQTPGPGGRPRRSVPIANLLLDGVPVVVHGVTPCGSRPHRVLRTARGRGPAPRGHPDGPPAARGWRDRS